MLRSFAAVALATSVVAVAGTAEAQVQERTRAPMGLRFEIGWNEDFNIARTGSSAQLNAPPVSPNGDIKVGYDFGQFTPLIGLSFANRSIDLDPDGDDSASQTVFILDLEGRYYFNPHRGNSLQPFVFGEFNTAFVSFSNDTVDDDDALDDAASELDFTEINAGLGMEYKFEGAAFAIGGKWGLGLAFQGHDEGDDSFGDTSIATSAAIYAAWRI